MAGPYDLPTDRVTGGGDPADDMNAANTAINDLHTRVDATVPKSMVDAKGDLLVGTADNTLARLPAGTDGQVIVYDSAEATGMRPADAPSGGAGGAGPIPFSSSAMWRDPYPPTGGSHALPASGTMVLWPIPVDQDLDLSGLGVRLGQLNSAAGYSIRVVVYADNGDFLPGDLIKSSSALAPGGHWENLGETFTAVDLPAGWVWVGYLPIYSSGTPNVRSLRTYDAQEVWRVMPNGTGSLPATSEAYGLVAAQTGLATPPATFGGTRQTGGGGSGVWQQRGAVSLKLAVAS